MSDSLEKHPAKLQKCLKPHPQKYETQAPFEEQSAAWLGLMAR